MALGEIFLATQLSPERAIFPAQVAKPITAENTYRISVM